MKKIWLDDAWEDYERIQEDRKLLKGDLSGYCSRRIDAYNRIVYKVENDTLVIVQCGTHYHK